MPFREFLVPGGLHASAGLMWFPASSQDNFWAETLDDSNHVAALLGV